MYSRVHNPRARRVGLGRLTAPAAEITAADPEALARAIKGARPGDTIVMADGTWRDATIVFAAQGEPGRPITLRAATPGKVVLSGASRLQIAGHDLVVDGLLFTDGAVTSGNVIEFRRTSSDLATRCRLTECAIVGYSPPDIKADIEMGLDLRPVQPGRSLLLRRQDQRRDDPDRLGRRPAEPAHDRLQSFRAPAATGLQRRRDDPGRRQQGLDERLAHARREQPLREVRR